MTKRTLFVATGLLWALGTSLWAGQDPALSRKKFDDLLRRKRSLTHYGKQGARLWDKAMEDPDFQPFGARLLNILDQVRRQRSCLNGVKMGVAKTFGTDEPLAEKPDYLLDFDEEGYFLLDYREHDDRQLRNPDSNREKWLVLVNLAGSYYKFSHYFYGDNLENGGAQVLISQLKMARESSSPHSRLWHHGDFGSYGSRARTADGENTVSRMEWCGDAKVPWDKGGGGDKKDIDECVQAGIVHKFETLNLRGEGLGIPELHIIKCRVPGQYVVQRKEKRCTEGTQALDKSVPESQKGLYAQGLASVKESESKKGKRIHLDYSWVYDNERCKEEAAAEASRHVIRNAVGASRIKGFSLIPMQERKDGDKAVYYINPGASFPHCYTHYSKSRSGDDFAPFTGDPKEGVALDWETRLAECPTGCYCNFQKFNTASETVVSE
ncbi:MAG: hypothetical protein HY927_07130 [Elusimicrobia bacterium]|nr:hypothetical protein [Elusimicrobiota bacterium]